VGSGTALGRAGRRRSRVSSIVRSRDELKLHSLAVLESLNTRIKSVALITLIAACQISPAEILLSFLKGPSIPDCQSWD